MMAVVESGSCGFWYNSRVCSRCTLRVVALAVSTLFPAKPYTWAVELASDMILVKR